MIDRIKALFAADDAGRGRARRDKAGPEQLQLAAAALLVEAALLDETFDDDERARIEDVLGRRFGLDPGEVRALIAAAEETVADSAQLHGFARHIRNGFSHAERVGMVEMLWEVVYADGVLHDHEASLMRRVGGLIYVSDQERGAARKRALARLRSAPERA
ncbi:MAG TPA: TerB family tellurite resistance protein [Alphaproteobacteria bacterium]|jgi:uncharacterized tellurite resistance protein B-like protein